MARGLSMYRPSLGPTRRATRVGNSDASGDIDNVVAAPLGKAGCCEGGQRRVCCAVVFQKLRRSIICSPSRGLIELSRSKKCAARMRGRAGLGLGLAPSVAGSTASMTWDHAIGGLDVRSDPRSRAFTFIRPSMVMVDFCAIHGCRPHVVGQIGAITLQPTTCRSGSRSSVGMVRQKRFNGALGRAANAFHLLGRTQ